MFTREHFEKIASLLSAANSDSALDDGARTVLHNLTESFADIFAESNERFSRKAFIGACNAASRSEIRRLVMQTNVKTIARNRARAEQKARV
jgi:hypothetical protein